MPINQERSVSEPQRTEKSEVSVLAQLKRQAGYISEIENIIVRNLENISPTEGELSNFFDVVDTLHDQVQYDLKIIQSVILTLESNSTQQYLVDFHRYSDSRLKYSTFVCKYWISNQAFRQQLYQKHLKDELDRQGELEGDEFVNLIVAQIQEGFHKLNVSETQKRALVGKISMKLGFVDAAAPSPQSLPNSPPNGETYDTRLDKSENAPDFIYRLYFRWLDGSFTRADLRRLDEKAEMALRNWERAHGRSPLNLPTIKQRNDSLASKPLAPTPAAIKDHQNLRVIKSRRKTQKHEL